VEYRGHVENGVIRPLEPLDLPNGTEVEFTPVANGKTNGADRADAEFWANRTADELCKQQDARPIGDPRDLAIDWPDEDNLDAFLQFIREVRR
jgi:hypothetical protein